MRVFINHNPVKYIRFRYMQHINCKRLNTKAKRLMSAGRSEALGEFYPRLSYNYSQNSGLEVSFLLLANRSAYCSESIMKLDVIVLILLAQVQQSIVKPPCLNPDTLSRYIFLREAPLQCPFLPILLAVYRSVSILLNPVRQDSAISRAVDQKTKE